MISFLKNNIFPYIAYFIITILSLTLKIKKINENIVEDLKKNNKKIIYVFWHGQQFLLVYTNRNKNIAILTSLSKDGDIQTKILSKFGYYCIRGSSSKGGVLGLREMIRAMRKGHDCAFAIDGPKGPIYKPKPGAVLLSKITEALILPVACSIKNAIIFDRAWDKYILPYPFSKALIIYGDPIMVKKDDDINLKLKEIEDNLNLLTVKANNYFK